MTILPAILAGAFFGPRGDRPDPPPVTVFRVAALVILVLSLASPFTIAGVGTSFIVCLELMHLAAAAAIVWSLTTLAQH